MKKVRIGVIGVRSFGNAHIRGIKANDNAELVAVCDVLEDVAKKASENYGVPYYLDYKELLKNDDIDAVTLALPDQIHREVAIAAMEAGKDVLCEKPMALNLEDCKAMVEASNKTGRKLMVGQICRKTPSFVLAKQMIERGEIGEVYFVESEYAHDYSKKTDATWRFDPASPRHPMIGGGCHAVDLMRWLCGDPYEVFAYGNHKILTTWPTDDCTVAIMKFPNDVVGKVFTSIGCKRKYTMRTVIYGSEGTIIVDNNSETLSLFKKENEGSENYTDEIETQTIECRIPVIINNHNVGEEVKDFVECILNDTYPEVNGIEGGKTVAVCCAIVKSCETGKAEEPDYSIQKLKK